MNTPSFREAAGLWARIGCLSFGGAAAQIAMLHRFVVEERRWVEERLFLDALNYCTLLPGPEAQQLATYLGWRMHGVWGGVVAGAFFVLPGALVMAALSLVYVTGQDLALVQGVFFGIKAAVLAIIAEALIRIGRRALGTRWLIGIAVLGFLGLVMVRIPFPALVLGAACAGVLLARWRPGTLGIRSGETSAPQAPLDAGEAARSAALWLAIWWAPVALAAATLGAGHGLVDVGLFFSKLAVVTFGGAYAVLAYLADAAVNAKGWVSAAEMIDGLGLAETTPGPTILVNQFVGFLAGWRQPAPFTPLTAALLSAGMAVWVTFAPSYVWIFAGGPLFERWRHSLLAQGALKAITATVCGVIASLAVSFGRNILFDQGVISLDKLKPDSAALALIAALLIFRLHAGVLWTVSLLALLGAALRLAPFLAAG